MPTIADKRKTFRALHASGCFVMPNPWNVGTARYLPAPRLQGAGDHERGLCLRAQAIRMAAVSRDDMLAHYSRACRRDRPAGQRRFRERLCARPGGRRRERAALHRNRRGRAVDRGFDRRQGQSALRFRSRRRAHAGRARRDRQGRRRRACSRPRRRLSGRPARSRRDRPPAQGLSRTAGADCLYAPGHAGRASRSRRPCKAVAPQAGQLPDTAGAFGVHGRAISPRSACAASASAARSRASAMQPSSRRRQQIASEGSFDGFTGVISNAELNTFFREDRKKRSS